MKWQNIRGTRPNGLAMGIRLLLGILFIMTGTMKLVVPTLASAWAGQLLAANIPLAEFNRLVVPFLEVAVGVALVLGFYARPASFVVLSTMVVATYVHIVVDDPTLFPLQPSEPIIPLVVIVLAVYIAVKGGGSRSLDLNAGGRVAA